MPLLTLVTAVSLAASPIQQQGSGIDRVVPPSPNPAGFIHDGGPVLAAGDLGRLNGMIEALQASGRGDIAVAIVRDLKDYPPYEVGTAIYRAWKVGSVDSLGSARRDLGALILIVPKELEPNGRGECWISTGLGAEGIITDATAATICRDAIIPHLKNKEYAAAIEAGINAIAAEFARGVPAGPRPVISPSSGNSGSSGSSPLLFVAGALGLLGLGGGGFAGYRRYKRRKPRPCPKGHGPMRLLDETADDIALELGQRKEESLRSVDYDVWECPTCGEHLVLQYRRWLSGYSKCPSCAFWTLKTQTRTLVPATTVSTGM